MGDVSSSGASCAASPERRTYIRVLPVRLIEECTCDPPRRVLVEHDGQWWPGLQRAWRLCDDGRGCVPTSTAPCSTAGRREAPANGAAGASAPSGVAPVRPLYVPLRQSPAMAHPRRVLGYRRGSTDEQVDSGLDLDIDTTTPGGRLVVRVFATVAEGERGIISERTKNALSTLPTQGRAVSRPSLGQTAPALADRIRAMRKSGMTLQAITNVLNAKEYLRSAAVHSGDTQAFRRRSATHGRDRSERHLRFLRSGVGGPCAGHRPSEALADRALRTRVVRFGYSGSLIL